MTSNEERRELAEIMRTEAQLWHILLPGAYLNRREASMFFQDIMHFVGINGRPEPEKIYNRLADLIDRPTTTLTEDENGRTCCANCGCVALYMSEATYCPDCGAEVIE